MSYVWCFTVLNRFNRDNVTSNSKMTTQKAVYILFSSVIIYNFQVVYRKRCTQQLFRSTSTNGHVGKYTCRLMVWLLSTDIFFLFSFLIRSNLLYPSPVIYSKKCAGGWRTLRSGIAICFFTKTYCLPVYSRVWWMLVYLHTIGANFFEETWCCLNKFPQNNLRSCSLFCYLGILSFSTFFVRFSVAEDSRHLS